MRSGFGFDAHRLVPGRPLVLAGVTVPFDKGLQGFSDGDVVAHALIDALLGAAALGDCGTHFPAGKPEFAGADSMDLLRRATQMLNAAGYRAVNVDCTIVAEEPALAPFIDEMRETLAAAADMAMEDCSVKAKHTEGLGYTGEGLGIAAYVAATIEKISQGHR